MLAGERKISPGDVPYRISPTGRSMRGLLKRNREFPETLNEIILGGMAALRF
jgi:hypothetical protein